MNDKLRMKAIAANIEAMQHLLSDAAVKSSEALVGILDGNQNQAIGTILDFDRKLEDALALYRAAVSLHRHGR